MNDQTLDKMLELREKLHTQEAVLLGFNLSEDERRFSVAFVVGVVAILVVRELHANIQHRRLAFSSVQAADVATSRYLPEAVMLLWRTAAAVFIFVTYFQGFSSASTLTRQMRVSTFTCWSWFMQGIFFSLAATATLLHLVGSKVPGTLKNAVWVMFEVFTAVSILICVVVWTVLIPAFEASGNTLALKLMYSWFGLTAHNANVALMAFELLVNRLSFRGSHMPFVICYGLVYLAFAMYYWRATGVLYYFFLDYTMAFAPLAYLALLAVMIAFYYLAMYAASALKTVVKKGAKKL